MSSISSAGGINGNVFPLALLLRPGPKKLVKPRRNTQIFTVSNGDTGQPSVGIEIFTVSMSIEDNTEKVQTQYCKDMDIFPYSMFVPRRLTRKMSYCTVSNSVPRLSIKTPYKTCPISKSIPEHNVNTPNETWTVSESVPEHNVNTPNEAWTVSESTPKHNVNTPNEIWTVPESTPKHNVNTPNEIWTVPESTPTHNVNTPNETCSVSKFVPQHNLNDLNTQEPATVNNEENNQPQQTKERPWYYVWIAVVVMFVSWIFIRAGDTAVLTHFPVRAQLMGFSKNEAALLLSIQGAAQTIMCIPWGFIGDIKRVSETGLITLGSILCGASTCLSLIYKTLDMMVIHSILFGIGQGKYYEDFSITSVPNSGASRISQGGGFLTPEVGANLLFDPFFPA